VLRAPSSRAHLHHGEAAGRAAILTDRTWRRFFGDAPPAAGRSVFLDGLATSLVGIVRANDSMGLDADLFLALDEAAPAFLDRRQPLFAGVVGRLKPAVDPGVAKAQLDAVQARIAALAGSAAPVRPIQIENLSDYYRASNGRPLYFLLGASLVVLLLSLVNVAALVLGRAFSRTREFALRGALGGGQMALARQLLIEGALLALPAGALGVLVARWCVGAIAVRLPDDVLLRGAEIPVDYRVAAFAFAVSALTALLVGLAPLIATRRLNLSAALGAAGRAGRSRSEGRARVSLLTVQLALTTVLLAGAAVFLKSFVALTHVPLGFDPERLVAFRTPLGGPRYSTEAQVREYADRLLETVTATPGVQIAAICSSSARQRSARPLRLPGSTKARGRLGTSGGHPRRHARVLPRGGHPPAARARLLRVGCGRRPARRHHQRAPREAAGRRRQSGGPLDRAAAGRARGLDAAAWRARRHRRRRQHQGSQPERSLVRQHPCAARADAAAGAGGRRANRRAAGRPDAGAA
jgi:hypothetical protein